MSPRFAQVDCFVDHAKDALRWLGENISSFDAARAIWQLPAATEVVPPMNDDAGLEDEVNAVLASRAKAARLITFLWLGVPHFMIPRHIRTVPEPQRTPTEEFATNRLRKDDGTRAFRNRKHVSMRQASHRSEARD